MLEMADRTPMGRHAHRSHGHVRRRRRNEDLAYSERLVGRRLLTRGHGTRLQHGRNLSMKPEVPGSRIAVQMRRITWYAFGMMSLASLAMLMFSVGAISFGRVNAGWHFAASHDPGAGLLNFAFYRDARDDDVGDDWKLGDVEVFRVVIEQVTSSVAQVPTWEALSAMGVMPAISAGILASRLARRARRDRRFPVVSPSATGVP